MAGHILNIASSSSLRTAYSAYSLSKWGIRGLTLGLAKLGAQYGITVNAIA
ncbi:MAG: SDR family NAD(P)-dependent oxidoreductase, partial [Anaeroplasmataceae bacterium]|nr:SDR family NAD(P)-dependent oxidoreductase [Anaeroplasmataceae bacterium]